MPHDILALAGRVGRPFHGVGGEQLVSERTVAQVLVVGAELVFALLRLGISAALIEQRASATSLSHPAYPLLNPTSIFIAKR